MALLLKGAPEDLGNLQSIASAASNGQHGEKARPGYYFDPKSGRTFRQARPKQRSKLYQEAENLERAAVRDITGYCAANEFAVHRSNDGKVDKVTTKDGHVLSTAQQTELDRLKANLANAKEQLKVIKQEEASKAKKAPNKLIQLDPKTQPKLVKDSAGKLAWADVTDA